MEQLDLLSYAPPVYPHAPAARRTNTSRQAADAMRPSASSIRLRVLDSIKHSGSDGATSYEIALALALPYEAVQPRTSELRKQGEIIDSGQRRTSRAEDKLAIVWRVAQCR